MVNLRHAYIISGKGAYEKALEMAHEAVSSTLEQHPDIKTVFREKTELTVGQVREVVSDSIVLPNQSEKKVYIFADGDYMNTAAQNAALKLLEEPPSHVIIILCCSKPEVFLPTVRSRCVEINLAGDETPDYTLAGEFLEAFSKDALSRISWLESNNKMSFPECRDFCAALCSLISDILCGRHDSYGIEPAVLISLEKEVEKCLKYLEVNVNVKQIFGLLEIF